MLDLTEVQARIIKSNSLSLFPHPSEYYINHADKGGKSTRSRNNAIIRFIWGSRDVLA